MKLSRNYQYHILCEDIQSRSFINAVLSEQGISARKVICNSIPCGEGCGEAAVRRDFPKEIQRLNATSYNKQVLIVCTDADKYTIDERKSFLDKEVKSQGVQWDKQNAPIMVWIPKRQIETWIHALNHESVDENMTFPHSGKPVSCKEQAKKFSMYCQDLIELEPSALNSMIESKNEYNRICRLQK